MRTSESTLNRLLHRLRSAAVIVALIATVTLAMGGCAAGIVFGDDDDRCQRQRSGTGECRPAT